MEDNLMAYNNNNNKDHQTKKMSYHFSTFFSSERKGNEFQLVKIGLYDGKLTFNFLKGTSGGGASEGGDAYASLEYETACLLKAYLDGLIRSRVERYRSGRPYEEVYVTYNITFQDKESHETRSAGSITFKTVLNQDKGNNTVHLIYTNGSQTFDLALGSPYLSNAFTHTDEIFTDVDKSDARLYALAYLFNNIIQNWPALQQSDKIAALMMNRIVAMQEAFTRNFNLIFKKMDIPIPQDESGGKYHEKYRSKAEAVNNDVPF
jgi:hypothetical protein